MMFKSFAAGTAVKGGPALRRTPSHQILLLLTLLIAPGTAAELASDPLPGAALPAASTTISELAATALAAPAVWRGVEGLSTKALRMALDAVSCARSGGVSAKSDLLTIIDYSLPSTAPRFWVLDLGRRKVLFHELVAHGAGSGDNLATRFSNTVDSRQSSVGLFLTGATYEGGNGYSLRLHGLDAGLNDRAEQRSIVIHGAWYVSEDHARQYGRLGRSWGCPALPLTSAHQVIDTIKDGSFVFSYAPGEAPRRASSSGNCWAASSPTAPVARATTAHALARAGLRAATAVIPATP